MKTGLIIYVVGNDAANFINDVTLQGQIPAWADIVEIAIQNNGHYDIHDAWWKLMARGMQRIICKSEIEALDAIKTLRDRDKPFKKIILGRPAFGESGDVRSYREDLVAAAEIVKNDAALARSNKSALVYMGHGNEIF